MPETTVRPLLVLLAIVAVVPPAWLAVAAWRRRETPGAFALAAMMLAASIWAIAHTGLLLSAELAAKARWLQVEFLAGTAPRARGSCSPCTSPVAPAG